MKIIRHSPEGVEASGPYTSAIEIKENGLRILYISGQGTRDPKTGKKFLGNIVRQTELAMENLRTVIEGCNFEMGDIVKITLFLSNSSNRSKVNEVYKQYFPDGKYPARSTVGAKDLPDNQGIEIDAVAYRASE